MSLPSPVPPDEGARLHDPRLTSIGLLVEVTSGLSRLFADQIADHDLTPSEFEVLIRLARSPASQLRMNDLAHQIGLSSSGLTRLADRLEGRALLVRRPCPDDGRGAYAQLTDDGHELMLAVLPGHLDLIERWFTGVLDPAQLDALVGALRTVRAVVHPGADAGADEPPADPDA
ncbi:MarR family transcriptional regulator [Iamia majanohamensis]|uniref:MarR family transcriptional regulator n=1 Tax=Iamia majanohamensis TaxID=467976 RepID=A0AAE9Y4Y9_9ACTN|nr:MarR family transcriptional regulator [Iamia majanohamensis]WCO65341.1 MarR family transcriptional regulator [Iamia majanohamensis]